MKTKLIPKLITSAAVSAALVTLPARAIQINGGISFAGDYRPVDGVGNVVADLTQASFLKFGPDAVAGIGPSYVVQANGDFGSIPAFSVATIASPIAVNPIGAPPATPIWSVG